MIIASIDIGTNTVLMLIADYDPATGVLKTIRNEHRIPRIGKGLVPGFHISDDKIELLMAILKEYKEIADRANCEKIIAAATNAFRIASNGAELADKIKNELNIDIRIISGEDESYLSYLGAASGAAEDKNTLVIDIGGGSTELIFGNGDDIQYRKSFQAGVVSLTEKFIKTELPSENELNGIHDELNKIFSELNGISFIPERTIAIAGTPTTLACIRQNLTEYSEDAIEGSSLTKTEISSIVEELAEMTPSEISEKYKAVVKGREDVLLAGSMILLHLLNTLKIAEVTVSTKGIRYGTVIKYSGIGIP